MKFFSGFLALVSTLLLVFVNPATAVTYGDLDFGNHPYVGLLLFEVDGEVSHRCTGTLIAPTVMLTAGHCTEGASGGRVWFLSDVDADSEGYPFADDDSVEFAQIIDSPDYNPAAFFLNDVALVILENPVDPGTFGVLPDADVLDDLAKRRGKKDQTFTAVGYGLQRINPVFVQADRVRMAATPRLIQINSPGFTGDYSILLSNNHSTGGTCFGDSGGPNFIGDSNVVGGVTSFGINGNCAGTGGVYRMDRLHDLDWIKGIVGAQ
jgi:secreted trypsin-like serine protease